MRVLADFNFTIRYRPRKTYAGADTLSRHLEQMRQYMVLCTKEMLQEQLRAVIQSIQLQDNGQVNWISSLTKRAARRCPKPTLSKRST